MRETAQSTNTVFLGYRVAYDYTAQSAYERPYVFAIISIHQLYHGDETTSDISIRVHETGITSIITATEIANRRNRYNHDKALSTSPSTSQKSE